MAELVSFIHQDIHWQVVPAYQDRLFPDGFLPLEKWLRDGQASIVKQAPHRTIYHVQLPGLAFYVKHYPVADLRSWLRQLVRPTKARTEYHRALEVAARGVPTFVPLAMGERHTWVGTSESYLITRDLEGAQPLQFFLENTFPALPGRHRTRLKLDLAEALGKLLSRMHQTGIRHDDLHAGNLLIRLDTQGKLLLFLIDLHAVRLRETLSWPARRENLVLLNRFFSLRASRTDRLRFWKAYYATGASEAGPGNGGRLLPLSFKAAARDIEQSSWAANLAFWKKRDGRCLGHNRHYHRISEPNVVGHVMTDLDAALLKRLLADPDEPFERPDVVCHKNSPSSTVVEFSARVGQEVRPVIYKRFRVTAWSDPLAALVRPGPALRSWKFGHAFRLRDIPTARPLLMLHRCRRGLWFEGYLLTEKIPNAADLRSFLKRLHDLPDPQSRLATRTLIDRVAGLVRHLHQCGLSHRDLKAANILVTPGPADHGSCAKRDALRVWLIDLVGIEQKARLGWARRVQNVARLHASFVNDPSVTRSDKLRFLRIYLQWGLQGRQGWKTWWRAIDRATRAKVAQNLQRGRPLA